MAASDNHVPSNNLAELILSSDWSVSVHLSFIVLIAVVGIGVVLFALRIYWYGLPFRDFELDEAEFGIGDQKIKLHPNYADRQLAYAIWVELSTRKVGLTIDLNEDVINQIYDSWHEFFSVTRELIKGIPVSRMRRDSTQKVVHLSIELLNEGLRPHLTRWQARFRRWYDQQLAKADLNDLSPQEIQKKYSHFTELEHDLMALNRKLIAYRKKMYELVHGR
jgi:hypothetical protein